MKEFEKLGLEANIIKSLKEEGFEKPTEIQSKSISLVLAKKDIIAGSATGSGKTLVFASGIIQNIQKGKGLKALVLTPTRELTQQIAKAFKRFSKYKPLEITTVYGGVSLSPQIRKLKTADVVIGTPGRILDHINRRTINLREIEILVLDEADRMLDMGFIADVEKIIRECGKKRQTMLFSATITPELENISSKYMEKPVRISAVKMVDPKKLKQVYYDVPQNFKFPLLVHLLKDEKESLVMVFCSTRRNTDFVASNLRENGINAEAIHGGFSQYKRNKALEKFHSKKIEVLVCTDVAARGLDIKEVSHIYNYDIPNDSKEYVHRIGRTARAGKSGEVINLLSPRDHDNFSKVLRGNDVNIKSKEAPHVERVKVKRQERTHRRQDRRHRPRRRSQFR